MRLMVKAGAAALLVLAPAGLAPVLAAPIPASFESTGVDRQAIEALLVQYTQAVSTKNEALFESLLLNRDIPFSGASSAAEMAAPQGTENYEAFRKGVFEGPAFTQRFQDVHIQQDGPLADVTLVYVNTAKDGSSWGWKTLQLLKVGGRWKIASEFFTGHGLS